MDKNFVYVFDIAARDLLLSQGFIPIKFDDDNNIFIFHNQENFVFNKIIHMFSDKLSF